MKKYFWLKFISIFVLMFAFSIQTYSQKSGNNKNKTNLTDEQTLQNVKLIKKLEKKDFEDIISQLDLPTFDLNLQFSFSEDDFLPYNNTLEEEIANLEKKVKKDRNNPQNFLKLAEDYKAVKDFKSAETNYVEAKKLFEEQIKQGKGNYATYFGLAEIYQAAGNIMESLEYFLDAAFLDQTKAEPYIRCAYLIFTLNQDFKTINNYLNKAQLRESNNVDILLEKYLFSLYERISFFARGDTKVLQKPIDEAIDIKTIQAKIDSSKENKKYQTKFSILEFFYLFMKFMSINLDKIPQGFDNLALLTDSKDVMVFQQSKNVLETTLKEKSSNLSMLYNALGNISLMELNVTKAEDYFLKSLEINPYRDEVYYNLVVLYYLQKTPQKIINIIIQKNKKYVSSLDTLILAKAYYKINDLKSALQQSLTTIKSFPNSHLGYLFTAIILTLTKQGDLKEVEDNLIKSLKVKETPEAYFNYGILFLLANQTENAYKSFVSCLNLDNNYEPALTVLKKYFVVEK